MYYKCEYFKIHELIHPAYADLSEQILWQLFSPEGLRTIDLIRAKVGPIIINNWHDGGPLKLSGFRPFDTEKGASYSGHKFGRCFDLHPKNMTGGDLIRDILKNPDDPAYSLITEVEIRIEGWAHISFRNWNRNQFGIHKIVP